MLVLFDRICDFHVLLKWPILRPQIRLARGHTRKPPWMELTFMHSALLPRPRPSPLNAYPYISSADLQVGCLVGLLARTRTWRSGRRQYSRSGERRYSNAQFADKL
jgi:hypothetical protein